MTSSLPEYRIKNNFNRPNQEKYKEFLNFPTATISDAFRKRQALPHKIKPVWSPVSRIVGPAITVNATSGDEILALKAIETAERGDVIVVAGNSRSSTSFWGGIMSTMAKKRGVVALITEGMTRDLSECREIEFPIWATGISPIAPHMDVPPGDLNLPIAIGEVIIHPGDLVVADEDGVTIVPQDKIHVTKKAVKKRIEAEKDWLEEINKTKEMILKDRVDNLLEKRTVEYLD